MSRWGIGPTFAFLSICYGAFILFISFYFYPYFQCKFLPELLFYILGTLLLLIGILFLFISVKAVMKAYNSEVLVTTGIYKYCRHPLYASWVLFIIPGIVLFVNSWIGFTIPLFMYFLLCKLVLKEEEYLEEVFGLEYSNYKIKTPCILPFGYLIK